MQTAQFTKPSHSPTSGCRRTSAENGPCPSATTYPPGDQNQPSGTRRRAPAPTAKGRSAQSRRVGKGR